MHPKDRVRLPVLYCEEFDIALMQYNPEKEDYWKRRKISLEKKIPSIDKPGKLEVIPFDDPRLLTCKFAPPAFGNTKGQFTTGYFGSQRLTYLALTKILPEKPGKYCDLTAGGCSVPYLLRKDGWDVSVNDFGYFSHMLGRVGVDSQTLTKDKLSVTFEPIKPVRGTTTENKDRLMPKASDELTMWIDGFIQHFEDSPMHLAALAKVIVSNFSYRSQVYDDTIGAAASPGILRMFIWRAMKLFQRMLLPDDDKTIGPGKAIWGDAIETSKKYDWTDTIMYADPAWAWSNGAVCEAYEWYGTSIAEMLLQGKQPKRSWWKGAKGEDATRDVTSWIANTLEQGAKAFIIDTQSTNAPDPVELCKSLVEKFGIEKVHLNTFMTVSLGSGKPYIEWYFVVGDPSSFRNIHSPTPENIAKINDAIEGKTVDRGIMLRGEDVRLLL